MAWDRLLFDRGIQIRLDIQGVAPARLETRPEQYISVDSDCGTL